LYIPQAWSPFWLLKPASERVKETGPQQISVVSFDKLQRSGFLIDRQEEVDQRPDLKEVQVLQHWNFSCRDMWKTLSAQRKSMTYVTHETEFKLLWRQSHISSYLGRNRLPLGRLLIGGHIQTYQGCQKPLRVSSSGKFTLFSFLLHKLFHLKIWEFFFDDTVDLAEFREQASGSWP
jgi:hypothetical protein